MTSTKNRTITLRIGISEEAYKVIEQNRIGFEKPGQTISRIIIQDHEQNSRKTKKQKIKNTKRTRIPKVTAEQEDIEK